MKNDKMKSQYRINEQIRVREVRIVGDNGSSVVPTRDALNMAREQGVDLVEISPNANPPVCRLIDYSKFLYQQKKRQKEMKAKQVKVEVKEIRFGPQTDEHDYQFKLKHAKEFLEEGNKVRAYVFFRGRSILFKEQGEVLLLRFANDLEEVGKVESMPSLEGKKMFLYLAPKKAGAAKKSQQARDREAAEAEAKEAKKSQAQQASKEVADAEMEIDERIYSDSKHDLLVIYPNAKDHRFQLEIKGSIGIHALVGYLKLMPELCRQMKKFADSLNF